MQDLFGEEPLRALSWKQPFGSAMLVGKIETRVWETKYRGLVLICLSKVGYGMEATKGICGEYQFARLMKAVESVSHTMNHWGVAIAVGRLVDCRLMKPSDEDLTYVAYRDPWVEHRTGKDGRIRGVGRRLYCHIYEDVREIYPVAWNGTQGWSPVPEKVRSQIKFK